MLKKFLKGKKENIARDNFLWNMVAGLINAAEAVVLMMVVTRTNGVEAAGILSIAFALGNLLMTIGKLGVRNFQVTDVKKEYTFAEYKRLRVLSCICMLLIAGIYTLLKYLSGNYSFEKAIVVIGICLIYVVEAFEDVYLGVYQEEGRLDISSKIFIIRWVFIMISFIAVSVIGHNLVEAVYISLIGSILLDIYLLRTTMKFWGKSKPECEWSNVYRLFKQCFVLFIAAFLTYYVTNAPKYAIDRYLTEDMQAYYGYISMPVFVVELLNCFLYQPQMVELAKDWETQNWRAYNKKILKQSLIIIILTAVCTVGAYLLGIPVLSVLYGVDLSAFRGELVILMISGGGLAFVGYSSVLLTIMRKQRILLINMLLITIISVCWLGTTVKVYGIYGAVVFYLLLMLLLALLNYCYIMIGKYRIKGK